MNNRQAGRRRGRGGQRQGGNPGRPDTGNRIDSRARGNAAQLLEKYKNMAQDAQRSGDRVSTEYYLQFADHYFRVLAESRARFEENGQRRARDDDAGDDDGEDFGFEGEIGSPASYQQPSGGEDGRDERPRRERAARDDREARPRRERGAAGDGEQRAPRPVGAGDDGGDERSRRYGRDANGEARDERPAAANDASDQPRRVRRPRREAEAGGEGFDAALLPPAIAPEAATPDADAGEKPRRGRPRRVRNDDEAVPPAA